MINQVKQFRKIRQRCFTLKLLSQKLHFKTFISKIQFKIAPSKNAFQNFHFISIVTEGIRTLIFLTKNSKKKKKSKFNFKQT